MREGTGNRERGTRSAILRLILFLVACFLFTFAEAHPANVASSQTKFAADGSFVATIRFDLAAFATGATPKDATDEAMNAFLDSNDEALKKTLAEAESRFRAGLGTEPQATLDQVEFPGVSDIRRYLAEDPKPRVPMMMIATVRGHLPKEARTVAFRYPATLDTVIQTIEIPYTEPLSEPVVAGQMSSTIRIPTEAEISRLAAAMNAPRTVTPKVVPRAKKQSEAVTPKAKAAPIDLGVPKPAIVAPTPVDELTKAVAKTEPEPAPGAHSNPKPLPRVQQRPAPSEPQSRPSAVGTYLRMGFLHILPEGLDHILFVVGLFLLGSNTKALLKQVTAFTVAHSITLALATLNVVRLPGRIIEPLIAASIAFVAIENLFLREVKPWRTAVVFLFGLVHGMGFAEVFANAGLRGRGLVEALLSFNVGVELGQLSVLAIAFAAIGWFRCDPRYRQWVVVPASVAIAVVALFWTVQRTIG